MPLLSIVIPCYNEEDTLIELLDLVLKSPLSIPKEIILVDDGSTDNSLKLAKEFASKNPLVNLISKKNGGKGSAVREGINNSKGDIIIIQDADLEYDPKDYQACIDPILSRKCKVVYGSRRLNKKNTKYSGLIFFIGGNLVTLATNILFFSRLTDEPTCYKTFHRSVFKKLMFKGNKFDWEPEITAKILKSGLKIKEVPISYYPRSSDEGKKIGLKDFFDAIFTLIKFRFVK